MTLVDEPATRRLFVSDMRGLLYALVRTARPSRRTSTVAIRSGASRCSRRAASAGCRASCSTRSSRRPARLASASSTPTPTPRTRPRRRTSRRPTRASTHDTVLLEWTAKTPAAAAYDGAGPRELIRLRQPFANHNGGAITFNPLARPGHRRFRPPLHRHRRRRERRRPDGPRPESRQRLRQDFPHRPARQERPRRQVRPPCRQSVPVDRRGPAGDLRLRRPQRPALRLGPQERRDVHVRHRPEHRRGSDRGPAPGRTWAGTCGKAASGSSAGKR